MRDWRNHWHDYAAHWLIGAVSGWALILGLDGDLPVLWLPALVVAALYTAYQGLSFAKKKDTVGLDMKDYSIGWGAGVIAAMLAKHAPFW